MAPSDRALPPRRSLGLRARAIAAFALGAALLSSLLAVSTYVAVRHTLLEQREDLAESQAYLNASRAATGFRVRNPDVPLILDQLENSTGTQSLIAYDGSWYTSSVSVDTLPAELRETVTTGTPARMRFLAEDGVRLAVGVPLPSVGATYFEVTDLEELTRTLNTLQLTLFIASLCTTLGGAALGSYASRRVLQPVTEAAFAAQAIAEGDMNTRLTADGDHDLDRLVLSFNRMVDALQTRMQRDARFASDVSHELRSPLMTLSSGLSVLQSRRQELPARSQTALDLLSDEVLRFQRMVQDLLEISRADAGHNELYLEEVLVGEFVTHVVEGYESEIPIEAPDDPEAAIAEVDKRRFARVIGNLIENADRYAGGVTSIKVVPRGSLIRIVIEDSGPGVPEDEKTRIFERFARGTNAKARASGEGTGLGLSLVDEHVRLHKGRVWVEDREEGGARFVVELPRVDI